MSLKQKAIKGALWSAVQNWGTQGVTFVVFTLLARLLDPKAFGLVALAGVFTAFVQVFLDRGFSIALVQRPKLSPEHLDTALWTGVFIGLVMSLTGMAGAEVVAEIFREPELAPIIRWLSPIFLIRGFSSVQDAILKRELNFKALALRSTVAITFSGVVAVIMAFAGFGIWCLVAQQLVNASMQVLVLWCVSDWRPRLKFSVSHFQELFAFAINIIGIDLVNFLRLRGDNFLIGYYLGSTALGYYSIAYRLLWTAIQLMIGILGQVALPTFAKLQDDPIKLKRAFYQATLVSGLIAIPVFLGMVMQAPELIEIAFGKQWLPSVPVMQILSLAGIANAFTYFNSAVMTALDKASWRLMLNFSSTLISLIGFAIAIPFGIIGVATAYVISNYVVLPAYVMVAYKLIGIDIKHYFSQFLLPLVCSFCMICTIVFIKFFASNSLDSTQTLVISTLGGMFIYAVSLYWFKPSLFETIVRLTSSIKPTITSKK